MSEHDPKRWSEEEDEAMRSFVDALKVEPSRENRDAVWAGVSAALGGGGNDGGADGGAKPSTAPPPGIAPTSGASGIGLGAKIGVGALGLLAAGALVLYTRSPEPRAPSPVASVAVVVPSVASSAPPEAAPIASASPEPPASTVSVVAVRPTVTSAPSAPSAKPSAAVVPVASVAATVSAATVSAADRLREETEGVRRARRSLRDGDPRAALAELDGLDRKLPAGLLEEEREVLRVEALYAAKDPSAARRAERFLLERPQSVHIARIKALLGR